MCYNILISRGGYMQIRQLTMDEFNTFAKNYEQYSVYQTTEYALAMEGQGFNNLIVGLVDSNNNILAAAILLIKKNLAFKYAYAPKGFLIDYHNFELLKLFTIQLKKFLAKRDIVAVKFNPILVKNIHDIKNNKINANIDYDIAFSNLRKLGYYHYGYNYYFEALKPRYEAIIDINKPYFVLFQDIKKEFRTKIRSADRNGIKIYKGKPSELNYLYLHSKQKYPRDLKYFEDLYNTFNKNNMIDFYYAKLDTHTYLKEMQARFEEVEHENNIINNLIITSSSKDKERLLNRKINSDNLLANFKKKLILAIELQRDYPDGIVLASILVATYRDTVYVLMDAYNPKYQIFNAKHLLIWKLIEKYSKMGYRKFNLGGVSNPQLEKNKYKGLNQFKTNFGAKIYEYAGDFEIITNNTKYFMYRNTLPIQRILIKK